MKKILFLDKRTEITIATVRTCAEFMSMCTSIALKDRAFIVGRPYARKAFAIVLFQSPWLGKVNPYWTKLFRCYGPEITLDEARGLFKPQLLIPLDQRPSRNQDSSKQVVRNPRLIIDPPKNKRSYAPSSAAGFSSSGRAMYEGQYAAWGPYTSFHEVAARVVQKVSVSTPNFRALKKVNYPWNNHSYMIQTSQEEYGTYSYSTPGSVVQAAGFIRGGAYQGMRIVDLVQAGHMLYTETTSKEALNKALTRAKATNVNLAQTYAERKQTVNLVTKSLTRLALLALALKKGNVKHARDLINGFAHPSRPPKRVNVFNSTGTHIVGRRYVHVVRTSKPGFEKKTFADLWLEYQYGWRPLLSDIYGSAELLANTYHLKKPISVSATKETTSEKSYMPSQKEWIHRTVVDRTRVVIQFQEPTEWTNAMSKTGLGNPALLAWELVPYSFVVDWVYPLGTYLKNLDALVGLNFTRWSTQTTTDVTLNSHQMTYSMAGSPPYIHTGSKVTIQKRSKNRVVSTLLPSVPSPEFKPSFGVERSLSAISLLTQIFSRGKTSMK